MSQQRGGKVYLNLSIIHITLSNSHQKAAFRDSTAGRLSHSHPSVRQICLALRFLHICVGFCLIRYYKNSATMSILHLYLSERVFIANLKQIMSILLERCINRSGTETHQLESEHACMSKSKRGHL